MNEFAALCAALDEAASPADKGEALARYFASAPPDDAAWALFFLSGRRLPQPVPVRLLREWAAEEAGVPAWLFAECHAAVGDLAETMALLVEDDGRLTMDDGSNIERNAQLPSNARLPNAAPSSMVYRLPSAAAGSLREWVERRLLPLRGAGHEAQRAAVVAAWRELDVQGRWVWNRLLASSFRAGVAQPLLARALAQASGVAPATIAQRLAGEWEPTPAFFARLLAAESADADAGRPFPFCHAAALDQPPEALGLIAAWQAEWKWDGLRAQLVRRQGQVFLWSGDEEPIAERFPEVVAGGALLPDGTVLDGELVPWRDDAPLPVAQIQARLGRKAPAKKQLDEAPVVFMAFDLLEHDGADIRALPLEKRREELERLLKDEGRRMKGEVAHADAASIPPNAPNAKSAPETLQPSSFILHSSFLLSPLIPAPTWDALSDAWSSARERAAAGLLLKRRDAPYHAGRETGDWLAWRAAPHRVNAVLIYAARGAGARANLYSDYTFGLWQNGELVPFTKASAGLSDAEIRKVDAFVRRNTLERFGPVRTVRPELVFEIGFDGVQRSPRHKSGLAVRSPRILRRHAATPAAEADMLDTIRALLSPE